MNGAFYNFTDTGEYGPGFLSEPMRVISNRDDPDVQAGIKPLQTNPNRPTEMKLFPNRRNYYLGARRKQYRVRFYSQWGDGFYWITRQGIGDDIQRAFEKTRELVEQMRMAQPLSE